MSRNAKEEITALLNRYCTLLDSGRLDQIAETIFTEDLEESHGVGMATSYGREQLTNWFKNVCDNWEGSAHFITNIDIEVEERRRRNIGSSAIGMGKLPDSFQGLGGR